MKRLVKYKTFQLVFLTILISISIASSTFQSQTADLIFEKISLNDGFPSRCIDCVLQDHLGLLWFGTRNGLVKYDGNRFTHYKHDGSDSSTIIYRFVKSLVEDNYGNIWIGTTRGLSQLIRDENRIINYSANFIDSLKNIYVNRLHYDKNGNLWIGTFDKGIYLLSKEQIKKNIKSYNFVKINLKSEIQGIEEINCITENDSGIFFGTENGLIKIAYDQNSIAAFQFKNSINRIEENIISDLAFDKSNNLWIGTKTYGLASFDLNNNTFQFTSFLNKENKLLTNWVRALAVDRKGLIWCGMYGHSYQGGLVTYDPNLKIFNRYLSNPNLLTSIGPHKWFINDLYIDDASIIWITTREGPIDRIIPEKNQVKFISIEQNNSLVQQDPTVYDFQPLSETKTLILTGMGVMEFDITKNLLTPKFPKLNRSIVKLNGERSLLLDTKGIIWIGTTSGFIKYDTITKKEYFTPTKSYNKPSIFSEDSDNNYWIATFGDGLIKLNSKTGKIKKYKNDVNDKTTIAEDYINCMYNDKTSDYIWLGTDAAFLIKFNKKTGEAKNYRFGAKASWIERIGKFENKKIWLATGLSGLIVFNPEDEKHINYSTNKGLPHPETQEAVKDKNGNYWILTNLGVSKLNPKTNTIQNFHITDDNNLERSFYELNETNVIFLKATKGFYYFYADKMNVNNHPPKMVFTDFKVFNKSLKNHRDSILTKHINLAKQIRVSHDKNDFTIEFAALHYADPSKNQYKYILEGFDKGWQYIGNNRTARYTAIPHGDYKFRVIGSNSDGIWATEPATFAITILPPWWKTWWAYSFYAGSIILLLTYFYLLQKRRLRIKHEIEMKDFESMKLKEVDQMKSKFFANISHEFRTPLTLIKGPVEKLLEKEKITDKKKIYKVILRNSERLLNLINELLDLSKLESGKMKVSAQKSDIVSFTKGMAMSFESYAQRKEILINVKSNNEVIYLFFDKEKMQKILTNLISNACKFTNEKAKIWVDIEEDITNKKVTIKVIDSGIGIPEQDLSRIFDRFYQGANNEHTDHVGTGIGLSLTKELVEMHHGKIDVESEENKGTTFTISLLLGRNHFTDDQIIYNEKEYKEITIDEDEAFETQSSQNEETTLLVVEDNKDVRDFIKSIIENKYQIIEAEDGSDGFNKAIEFMPDLIVSDIMMPIMMGDEMTEKLKKDKITSHIPIILLTAKASEEEKVNGLKTGADDYLIKPFNEKELLARINNLINQRRKLREKYLREAEINPSEVAVTSLDKKFIENVIEFVEENISNPNIGVDNLANRLAVSRAQLYRKFSSILGEKPNEFIRKQRIKRAAELIRKDFGNITEIAYEVGFNDLSYFSKCFKNMYKITPHEYSIKYLTDKNY